MAASITELNCAAAFQRDSTNQFRTLKAQFDEYTSALFELAPGGLLQTGMVSCSSDIARFAPVSNPLSTETRPLPDVPFTRTSYAAPMPITSDTATTNALAVYKIKSALAAAYATAILQAKRALITTIGESIAAQIQEPITRFQHLHPWQILDRLEALFDTHSILDHVAIMSSWMTPFDASLGRSSFLGQVAQLQEKFAHVSGYSIAPSNADQIGYLMKSIVNWPAAYSAALAVMNLAANRSITTVDYSTFSRDIFEYMRSMEDTTTKSVTVEMLNNATSTTRSHPSRTNNTKRVSESSGKPKSAPENARTYCGLCGFDLHWGAKCPKSEMQALKEDGSRKYSSKFRYALGPGTYSGQVAV